MSTATATAPETTTVAGQWPAELSGVQASQAGWLLYEADEFYSNQPLVYIHCDARRRNLNGRGWSLVHQAVAARIAQRGHEAACLANSKQPDPSYGVGYADRMAADFAADPSQTAPYDNQVAMSYTFRPAV